MIHVWSGSLEIAFSEGHRDAGRPRRWGHSPPGANAVRRRLPHHPDSGRVIGWLDIERTRFVHQATWQRASFTPHCPRPRDFRHRTMRIEHLRIEGFKSWREVDLRLAPITGLFGSNSSGKSSLIQFLLMLKQTKEATDRSLALDFGGSNSYAYLGSFRDVVFYHNEEKEIRWTMGWRLPVSLEIIDPTASRRSVLFNGDQMTLTATVEMRDAQPVTSMIEYKFASEIFALRRKKSQATKFQLEPSDKAKRFHFIRNQGRPWTCQALSSLTRFQTRPRPTFRTQIC